MISLAIATLFVSSFALSVGALQPSSDNRAVVGALPPLDANHYPPDALLYTRDTGLQTRDIGLDTRDTGLNTHDTDSDIHDTVLDARDSQSVTALSSTELAAIVPYVQFARAAYCPKGASTWTCGPACTANKEFIVTRAGGDGAGIQYYYVGYWAAQHTVVVGHEGTDPTRLLADLTDLRLLKGFLSSSLFPGIGLKPLVHIGFRDEHRKTAKVILEEVAALMDVTKTRKVAVVGHSLGGALAELDAVYLALNLPKALEEASISSKAASSTNVTVKAVTFGKPRVGNKAWAELVDKHVIGPELMYALADIVPVIPPMSLGFLHPRGEVHLLGPGNAVACPGNDDTKDAQCQDKTVPTLLQGSIMDHVRVVCGLWFFDTRINCSRYVC
ncbi:alpha/beta-hydrolase [Schizophyllum commune Tattone D]|nr:alpha/beta-hydrolase [Schizophyllum commune Tattone D]